MSRKPLNVERISETCKKENEFYRPKYLFWFALIAFILAFVVARSFIALERAGVTEGSSLIFNGFHLHHWVIGLFALMILIPLALFFTVSKNQKGLGITIILVAFFLGLFIDGIVWFDSVQFWE